jgi:hypothetical protein
MPIYGLSTDFSRNVYTFATLTEPSTSETVEVRGSNLTFICTVVGGNITWQIQGSIDGSTWASLDPEEKNKAAGTHAHFYTGYVVRYVRIVTTTQQNGRTLSIMMAAS